MNSWLFLSLLLAHVIGDFYLQNDKYCALACGIGHAHVTCYR